MSTAAGPPDVAGATGRTEPATGESGDPPGPARPARPRGVRADRNLTSPAPLDAIDKAIIRELQVDGRLSYAQLGPLVGLSQAAARQRVQRLIDRGVMQVVAVTDPLMLGFSIQAMVGVHADGDLKAVARVLAQLDEIDYVVVCAGGFDLLVEVVCEDNEQLLSLVNDVIRSQAGVRSAEVFTYLHLEKQTYSWGTR